MKSDLNLDTAIQMVRQSELVKFQVAGQSDTKHLGEVHQRKGKPHSARRPGRNISDKKPKNSPPVQPCSSCNRVHKQDEVCPAKRKRCSRCWEFFLGAVNSCDEFEEPWSVLLHVNKKPIKFKIDTGADISVMSVSTYEALPQRPKLKSSNAMLSSPGGMLNCKGQFTAEISLKNKLYFIDIYVIEGVCVNNLLSRHAACQTGLVQRVEESTANVFGDNGLMNCEQVTIELTDDAKPYCIKVEWYPIYGPKSLFKFGEKDQLCAIALVNRKLILKVLLKMVAMATIHSLLR